MAEKRETKQETPVEKNEVAKASSSAEKKTKPVEKKVQPKLSGSQKLSKSGKAKAY